MIADKYKGIEEAKENLAGAEKTLSGAQDNLFNQYVSYLSEIYRSDKDSRENILQGLENLVKDENVQKAFLRKHIENRIKKLNLDLILEHTKEIRKINTSEEEALENSKSTGFNYEKAKKLREDLGLKQSQLIRKLRFKKTKKYASTLSRYERGVSNPEKSNSLLAKKYVTWLKENNFYSKLENNAPTTEEINESFSKAETTGEEMLKDPYIEFDYKEARKLREDLKLSQNSLVEKLGYKNNIKTYQSTLSKYENGKFNPKTSKSEFARKYVKWLEKNYDNNTLDEKFDPNKAMDRRVLKNISRKELIKNLGYDESSVKGHSVTLYKFEAGKYSPGNPPKKESFSEKYLLWLKSQGYNPYKI